MFLGGMGGEGFSPECGKPDYPESKKVDERLKEISEKLDNIPEQGKADYFESRQAQTGLPGSPERDLHFMNKKVGAEYGGPYPTGEEQKNANRAEIKTAKLLEDVRDRIEHMDSNKQGNSEKAEEGPGDEDQIERFLK